MEAVRTGAELESVIGEGKWEMRDGTMKTSGTGQGEEVMGKELISEEMKRDRK